MNNSLPETLYREIRDFAAKIMNEANYNLEMQNSVVDKLFKKELPPWKKGMFLYYKDLFTQYKN